MKSKTTYGLLSKFNLLALGAFVAFFVIILLTPKELIQSTHGLEEYLPLHSLMETFAIIVSVLTFTMGWENRAENKNINTVIVACAFLGVAIIDFAHIFSFPGMPAFITPASANKSIFFWLSGRLAVALTMLFLVSSSPKFFRFIRTKYIILSVMLVACAIIYWIGFSHLHLIPETFIEGIGLTPFKIYAEATIVAILVLSFFILFKRSQLLAISYDLNNIIMAMSLMIISELFFMIFTEHADLYNFLGHLYKVLSYNYFYQALFKESIQKPYAELDQKNHELQMARIAADDANLAKSQFLANISHEIRTPMNAIVGLTELLEESKNSSEQKEYLELLKQSEEHLLNLVNNILTLSRIEAGLLDLHPTEFNLHEELPRLQQILKVMADKKNLELQLKISSEVPHHVVGDLSKLNQVIMNLVDNAIKFTEKGFVQLDVSASVIEQNNAVILFQVRDSGIGIPKDKIKLLFQNFSQVDSSNTRKYGGTGLGLAISKNLIELMRGKIWVESEPERGSVFSFTIPLKTRPAKGL